METIAALFSADAIDPEAAPTAGGQSVLDELVDKSHKHAVGVSKELRHGIRESIELLANEVIEQLDEQARAQQRSSCSTAVPMSTPRELTSQCLRYLYRLLVLLYAESRPELGILPVDDAGLPGRLQPRPAPGAVPGRARRPTRPATAATSTSR